MTMEVIFRMSRYSQLSPSAYENAMELFLSEYSNEEMRKQKRCVDGYHSSGRSKKQNEKKKGLIIDSDDSDGDVDDNENSPLVFPGDELCSSSEEESESDSKDEV